MTVQVIACAPPKTDANGELKCPCCGRKYEPLEEDLLAICWECQFGNPECARCREEGVLFTRFKDENPIAHTITEPGVDGIYTTTCGQMQIDWKNSTGWMAPGVRFCAICCPDMVGQVM